jgi:hypothetical protein
MINMHPLQKLNIEKWFLIISLIFIMIITISMGILIILFGDVLRIIIGAILIIGSIGLGITIPFGLRHYEERKRAIINGIESGLIKIDERDKKYKIE